eukprot:2782102-Prymnesium_polylepis.1
MASEMLAATALGGTRRDSCAHASTRTLCAASLRSGRARRAASARRWQGRRRRPQRRQGPVQPPVRPAAQHRAAP